MLQCKHKLLYHIDLNHKLQLEMQAPIMPERLIRRSRMISN